MTTKTWIFQCNPDMYRLEAFLDSDPEETNWLVRQHAKEVSIGDRVYLWQAAGKEKAVCGILAKCTVISEVFTGPDDEASRPFWVGGSDPDDGVQRVKLRIDETTIKRGIIRREWLVEDPVCHGLSIIKQPTGTNFRVNADEAKRLDDLWSVSGLDWGRAEAIAALLVYHQMWGQPISKLPASPVSDLALRCKRSIGSAYNKVLNFRAIDPRDERAGLSGTGAETRAVWEEFFDKTRGELDIPRLENTFADLWPESWAKPTVSDQNAELEARIAEAEKIDLQRLVESQQAKRKPTPPRSSTIQTIVYDRDPEVIAIAKKRAKSRCEVPDCNHPSFQKPDGEFYVEVHHIQTLAEQGLDTTDNVACLCPGHHREIHHGAMADQIRETLRALRAKRG